MKDTPNKMNGNSLDISAENRARLKVLFPSVFTETVNDKGELVESVDFEKLKAELGTFTDLFENRRERYGMDWPGKKDSLRLIQTPSAATLKPCREESVNFDTTENLFIEGDNLEVLKLLQKSYYGKVKMIDIDPPYNTGKEFIYPDNFAESLQTYLEYAGLVDGDGKKFSTNTANEGRFHTKWLNMMYPRLYLARNLLRDDGVIFIHIDDNEVSNLRKMCDEIFGEENLLAQFVWRTDGNFDNQAKVKNCHEYIVSYCKNLNSFPHPPVIDPSVDSISKLFKEEIRNTIVKNGPANPISKIVLPVGFQADFEKGRIEKREDAWPRYLNAAIVEGYKLTNETTIESGWSSKDLALEFINGGLQPILDGKNQETTFVITKTGTLEVIKKRKENQSHVISVLTNLGNTQTTSATLKKENIHFDYPKPIQLEKYLLSMNEGEEFIALDFFGGSGTLGQAVLELNSQKSNTAPKRIKFIVVQLPEPCDVESSSYKDGCKSIADVAKERIRRVIKKLNDEQKGKLDLDGMSAQDRGFKVLKLNKSNFKQWQNLAPDAKPEQIQKQLFEHIDHLDHKATPEDLLYEILIKAGFTPTEKVEVLELKDGKLSRRDAETQREKETGKDGREKATFSSLNSSPNSFSATSASPRETIFSIADGGLLICLADAVTKELINAVAEAEPMQFICLDSAFGGNDQLKANAVQTFNARNMGREKANQIVFRTV